MSNDNSNRNFWLLALVLLLAVTGVYSNHFRNDFHFDDSHAIVNNIYIRDLKNIPLFFKDASTISSLPQNQSYRPMLTLSYAIDYWLAGNKLDTFYFHLDMFFWYLLLCVLLFFLFRYIFDKTYQHRFNNYSALLAAGFFSLHTVNAETINYISSRSDSFSTFWLVLGLVVYIYFPAIRKYFLYLLPVIIGILFKPSALVFAPILSLLIWQFEKNLSYLGFFSPAAWKKNYMILFAVLTPWVVCLGLYFFQSKMTPATFDPGNKLFNYLITQPYVIFLYLEAFFLPLKLSADTDLQAFTSISDPRFFLGITLVIALVTLMFFCSTKSRLRPVAFGLAWYFLALLPSSSIVPLAEVMNDHRMFFPNIGLVMAVVWPVAIWVYDNEKKIAASFLKKGIITLFIVGVLAGHAYGTHQRNKVWLDGETLWYDVSVKSPKNGRGLMNYGLRMMEKGDYPTAEKYFTKALKYNPNYSYLHVNLAILYAATGRKAEAEKYFLSAEYWGVDNPEVGYFFGRFLFDQKRIQEAETRLKMAVRVAPAHISSRHLLMEVYYEQGNMSELRQLADETLSLVPDDERSQQYQKIALTGKSKLDILVEDAFKNLSPEKFLELSLKYYQAGKYELCINAAKEALKLKPQYAAAWNNICSAYNQLGNYDEAIRACNKALEIQPDYSLAKGNLNAAQTSKNGLQSALDNASKNPTADNYITLSLVYYRSGKYNECIEACRKALKINPKSDAAYNNICSAYNQLGKWELAIEACEKALQLNPSFELAKNNLAHARKQKKNQ